MKFSKKIAVFMVVIMATFGLASCKSAETADVKEGDAKKIKVVTTIFPQYDFAKTLLGDAGDVKMLLKPGAESHSYEPTPQDIKTIQEADLFIYTGGENDVWVEKILKDMGDKAPETIELIDEVNTYEEEVVEGMEDEHDHHDEEGNHHDEDEDHHDEDEEHHDEDGDHHDEDEEHHHHEGEMDEHVWTDPNNAIQIVSEIKEKLLEIDGADKESIAKNAEKYIQELKKIDKKYREVVDNGKRKTIVFGDRFPFRYLAERYGLSYYAAFTGCSTDTEASASTIKFLIDKVKKGKIPVVFSIEMSNKKIANSVCDATGAKNLTLHSAHNLSKDEIDKGVTYLSIQEDNIKALEEALR